MPLHSLLTLTPSLATALVAQEALPSPAARIAEVVRRAHGFGYSGSVLVERDGELLYAGGCGLADRERPLPNTPGTLFPIGSMTKQFTAAAVLLLEEQGRLALDDRLEAHLARVPADKAEITLRQLLSHTSGLPTAWFDQFDPTPSVTRDELVERVLALAPIARPGKQFVYSNAGYQLLAALVELRSGTDFWSFVRARVLAPAGMECTRTPRELGPLDALARGYEGERAVAGLAEARGSTWLPAGDSGLVSSVEDLRRWFAALASSAVLSPASTDALLTPGLERYGLGLWIRTTKRGTRAVMHGGDVWGYGAEAVWYADEDALVIATSNDRPNYSQYYRAVTQGSVPEILFGAAESAPLPDSVTLPAERLAPLAGRYALPDGAAVVLAWRDGRLSITAEGQAAIDALVEQTEAREALARCEREALALVRETCAGERARLDELLAPGVYDGDPARVAAQLGGFVTRLGALREARVLGTAPGFYPPRSTTFLELELARGRQRFQITWQDGGIWWTDTNVLGPAFWNLQPESAERLVGFDLATRRALRLSFDAQAQSLTVLRAGAPTFHRRP